MLNATIVFVLVTKTFDDALICVFFVFLILELIVYDHILFRCYPVYVTFSLF